MFCNAIRCFTGTKHAAKHVPRFIHLITQPPRVWLFGVAGTVVKSHRTPESDGELNVNSVLIAAVRYVLGKILNIVTEYEKGGTEQSAEMDL